MDTRAQEHLNALQTAVAEAQWLMEVGGWKEAEGKLREALEAFERAGLVMEPQHEWLRLQSLHAECLFWLGDFERAESVFEAASLCREEAGIRDGHYIRQ